VGSGKKAMDFVSRAGNGFGKKSGPDWKELKGKLAMDFGRFKDLKIDKI